jgi:hypothetical protein
MKRKKMGAAEKQRRRERRKSRRQSHDGGEAAALIPLQRALNQRTPEERAAEAVQFCREHPEFFGGRP